MQIAALIIACLFFLVGVLGSILPVLPGAPLIWLGMLIYAFAVGFNELNTLFFIIQGALALAVIGADYLATAMGSRRFGGSKAALWGAMLGLFVGLFFFPIGLIAGPFLGAVLADLIFSRKIEQAVRSGLGASLGFWLGIPVKLALEAAMIIWFFVRIF
ncbi:MAG: DUF456 domain-containing protein [Bacillota bacterium]